MDKEVTFLKFLDGELTATEKKAVEESLKNDPVARRKLEEVKIRKNLVMESIRKIKV